MQHQAYTSNGLQITDEPSFHRLDWTVQRISWAVFVALLLAAALGVFGGGGPLSEARARTPDGALAVSYQRFARVGAPTELQVQVGGALVDSGEIRLRVSREVLANARVEWITPLPLRVEAGGEEMVYVFAARPRTPSALRFSLQMEDSGRRPARFALADRALHFTQLVYP